MAKLTLSGLLGIRPGRKASAKTSTRANANQNPKETVNMQNFSHLDNGGPDSLQGANKSPAVKILNCDPAESVRPVMHSREHFVAITEEAKASPVLAVRLLKTTDLSPKKIAARLKSSPEALSAYTKNFMEENDPTWEFQDDSERATTAQTYALTHDDKNGYLAAKKRAAIALEKLVEPMTQEEHEDHVERMVSTYNALNPDSADNQAERKDADREYEEAVAKAAARRESRYMSTSKPLRR